MPPQHPSATLKDLIQYTTLAATAAKKIADSAAAPFLGSAAALTLSILNCVTTARSNRDECIQIIEHIHEILCNILKLYQSSEIDGVIPTALLYDIAKFTETLQKVFTVLHGQDRMGMIKKLLKQPDNTAKLQVYKQELNRARELFKVQAAGSTLSQIVHMKMNAKQQHEELVALLKAHPTLTTTASSSVTGTFSSSENSLGSFSILPPSPKIFNGRDSELQHVVMIMTQDCARIAILGAGGMGKTSLATAAIHDVKVEAKYGSTYIGVEKGSNLVKKIILHFTHSPASLLVLDNLETPWESVSSRSEVEEFLSLLTDIPHLGLMITMRGAERPQKVKWTRPFLLPLNPISTSAAFQTFIDVADNTHDEEAVKQLLELTGNLPLAVSLIASVADAEGCDNTLCRWNSEHTRMLSEGWDKRSNLDISIMLSFTSSRMTTGAQELLSILSILPDGLADADLVQAKLSIPEVLACKGILISTCLAFIDKDRRLKVLVPIREHIHSTHPPPNTLKLAIRKYFNSLLDLCSEYWNLNAANIVPQIQQNLGNLNNILLDGLSTECPDMMEIYKSILFLNHFYRRTQSMISPLLLKLSEKMAHCTDQPIFGDYMVQLFDSSAHFAMVDADVQITSGTQYFQSQHPLEQAKWYRVLGFYYQHVKSNAAKGYECNKKALSLSNSVDYPTTIGQKALFGISIYMITIGDLFAAQEYARQAQRYAEHLGDIYAQAESIYLQARGQIALGNFQNTLILLQKARQLLNSCGLQRSMLDMSITFVEAEIHLMKTEYHESLQYAVSLSSMLQPKTYFGILADLNIVLVEITTGVDFKIVLKHLETCQSHITRLYGLPQISMGLVANQRFADLYLREGDHNTANIILGQTFASSQSTNVEGALICLERLADLSTGMNNVQTTLRWAGVFLGLALKMKEKLPTLKALRCLGQILCAEGDNETALCLFNVALDGFTVMDIHRWRGDCMVRIADILEEKDIFKSVGLWKAARPLFERSSQVKDITCIDVKLAAVDAVILEEHKRQLVRLNELNTPGEMPKGGHTNVDVREEQEENHISAPLVA